MNKKFLSAVLFGALMVTSTGTFVSCKDYDDDIKNLQGQIDSNKDAIAALQKLVGEGNWVTGITSIENGFTITMSNGQTQTVTGINGKDGVDGKNGTEWTIGEDGFWYKDGEKTDSKAIATDGKPGANGVTAPSPYINADGLWVVYEWNAEKSEFVAKTTEISAQGTSAYVVAKDGVYVLHIADETGKFTDVTLPATSDSFVVEAPYSKVEVKCLNALWNPSTTSANYQTLLKKFSAIGEIAKNTKMKQNAELPVLVTPANADLADGFTFSLQTLKGMVDNMTISNPTKGLSSDWNISDGAMSRAASTEDCLWTLQVEPVLVNNAYKNVDGTAALVVENAKGTVVKTTFAYEVSVGAAGAVKINGAINGTKTVNATYDASIDLFAGDKANDNKALVTFENEYRGYYIITLPNTLDVEKYGLSIAEDGHTLNIANMPANVTTVPVELEVVALGLNGSTAKVTVTVNVTQDIAATGVLADKSVTLSTKKIGNDYAQNIQWNASDLNFTATQMNAFLNGSPKFAISYIDVNGDEQPVGDAIALKAWKADGTTEVTVTSTEAYKNAAKIGFQLNSNAVIPGEYYLTLTATEGTGTTAPIIYSAKSNLTVANPKAEDLFSLATAYTADGKVLQVVGTVTNSLIKYDIESGIVVKDAGMAESTTVAANEVAPYVDADYAAWLESDGSAAWGSKSWVTTNNIEVPIEGVAFGNEGKNRLNKERNITANYQLFGNAQNVIAYNFKVKVMSPVYTSDASNITLDADALTGEFAYAGMKDDPNVIDMRSAVSAKYAVGKQIGKPLYLFTLGGTTPKVADETNPKMVGTYVLGKDGNRVAIKVADLDALIESSNKDAVITELLKKDKLDLYLTKEGEESLTIESYSYKVLGWDDIYESKASEPLKTVYNNYKGSISFNTKDGTPQGGVTQSSEIKDVVFEYVNKAEAEKYLDTTEESGTDLLNGKLVAKNEADITENPVDGKAVIAMKMTVIDTYGMKMTKTFDVTISIHK